MKHKVIVLIILIISLILSISGFFVDFEERVPSIGVNVLDILLMTVLFFGFGIIIYLIMIFISKMLIK